MCLDPDYNQTLQWLTLGLGTALIISVVICNALRTNLGSVGPS